MSRITGSEVASLMEAYSAVYAPQELTEEQIWEEVENWVNSLLEEGYDLSEYTWEEMYEAYLQLDEVDLSGKSVAALNRAQNPLKSPTKGKVDFSGRDVADLNRRQLSLPLADEYIKEAPVRPTLAGAGGDKQLYQNRLGAFIQGAQAVRGGSRVRPTLAGAGGDKQLYQNRLGAFIQGAQAAKVKKTEPRGDDGDKNRPKGDVVVQAAKGGVPGTLNKTTGKWTASGSAPATPKVAPTKPAAPAGPAMGKLGGTTFERRTPTSAELKAAQAARASGASPEKALQAAKAVSAPKVAPSNTLSSTVAAASKPAAFSPAPEVKATNTIAASPKPAPVSPRQQRLNMEMEYDAYDIVLEYLLSEGHVETVEEAHYVMMEMDAETIGSIVEAKVDEKLPEHERSGARLKRYDNPSGALALGGGQQRARREEHKERRGKKAKG
jgi:hypothetical protein